MKTYKNVQNFLDSHENNRALHISDDGIAESEIEYLFHIETDPAVFCLLTTQFDILCREFPTAYQFIKTNGGIVHECCEWHNGSQRKTGYIVYQHPCEKFRSRVEDIFY